MGRRAVSLVLAAAVLCVSALSLRDVWREMPAQKTPRTLLAAGREAVAGRLRQLPGLAGLAPGLLFAGGQREENGVYYGKDRLLLNLAEPDYNLVEQNMEALQEHLAGRSSPWYFALIPTACAIEQEQAPPLAPLFNQRRFIGDVYDQLYGQCSTVDVYQSLWNARDQYIYYRTDANLTSYGGFIVYQKLGERMGLNPRGLDQFEVEHLAGEYRGDLAALAPGYRVTGDILTLYRFSRFGREYRVTRWEGGEAKQYASLFPRHLLELEGDRQRIFLGGMGERVDIATSAPYQQSLLVLGDETALSFLPFLAVHFRQITFVGLEKADEEVLAGIDPEEYDLQLVVLGLDSFIHGDGVGKLRFLGFGS